MNKFRAVLSVCALFVASSLVRATGQDQPYFQRLIAGADLIVVGTVNKPVVRGMGTAAVAMFKMNIAKGDFLKGSPQAVTVQLGAPLFVAVHQGDWLLLFLRRDKEASSKASAVWEPLGESGFFRVTQEQENIPPDAVNLAGNDGLWTGTGGLWKVAPRSNVERALALTIPNPMKREWAMSQGDQSSSRGRLTLDLLTAVIKLNVASKGVQ